uniref:Uncharacterized protein n=1 Tax=Lepeophtheirus salmonis TaxID=72036 RepID=A0A0K2UJG8_LEPSM
MFQEERESKNQSMIKTQETIRMNQSFRSIVLEIVCTWSSPDRYFSILRSSLKILV